MDDPARRWSFFAYSFAVFQSGRVYRGRGMNWVPAGQEGHNTGTVAVLCVVGPGDDPSPAMLRSLRGLRAHCERKAGHGLNVRGHGEVVQTACPGPELRRLVRELE